MIIIVFFVIIIFGFIYYSADVDGVREGKSSDAKVRVHKEIIDFANELNISTHFEMWPDDKPLYKAEHALGKVEDVFSSIGLYRFSFAVHVDDYRDFQIKLTGGNRIGISELNDEDILKSLGQYIELTDYSRQLKRKVDTCYDNNEELIKRYKLWMRTCIDADNLHKVIEDKLILGKNEMKLKYHDVHYRQISRDTSIKYFIKDFPEWRTSPLDK